jgi:hypothetical protein
LCVDHAFDEAIGFSGAQLVGERALGAAGKQFLQLAEAQHRFLQQMVQNHAFPFATNQFQSRFHAATNGAFKMGVFAVAHVCSLYGVF